MSEIGLAILGERDRAQDRLNYLAKAPNGRIVNSSTIVLRDGRQRVFGALCINIDVTAIRHAAAILDTLSGHCVEPKPTTFSNDIRDVIDVALREVLHGRAAALLSRQERLDVFRALDARSIFSVKRAMNRVAAALNVSRATAYSCLQIVRAEAAKTKPANSRARRVRVCPDDSGDHSRGRPYERGGPRIAQLAQDIPRRRGARRCRLRRAAWRSACLARRQRGGQEHADQGRGRALTGRRRRNPHRRPTGRAS
jgi:predicted transcriptional regulator YheO